MKSHLEVKIVPSSSRTEIAGWLGESLKIKVAAPPEKGKANLAVIRVLSERLGLSESAFKIISGATSQRKMIEIESGFSQQQLDEMIARLLR